MSNIINLDKHMDSIIYHDYIKKGKVMDYLFTNENYNRIINEKLNWQSIRDEDRHVIGNSLPNDIRKQFDLSNYNFIMILLDVNCNKRADQSSEIPPEKIMRNDLAPCYIVRDLNRTFIEKDFLDWDKAMKFYIDKAIEFGHTY